MGAKTRVPTQLAPCIHALTVVFLTVSVCLLRKLPSSLLRDII